MALKLLISTSLALVAGGVAFAVFPGSSKTSAGLNTISTRGTPVSFTASAPRMGGRLGTPYVLAERGGKAFFRVEREGASPCYGTGRLALGKLQVLGLECSSFPSTGRPVLDEIGVEVRNRETRSAGLLFVQGFAADGIAEIRLVDRAGRMVSKAGVERNVFHLDGVTGVEAMGSLIALDARGHQVWKRIL